MYGQWLLAAVVSVFTIIACLITPGAWFVGMLILLVLWSGLAGYLAYRKFGVSYRLTSQRLQHERGIFLRRTDRVETIDIDDVTFTQGLVERLFGVGTIRLTSSDKTDPELVLLGIDEVQRVANLIDEVRRQERRRRGVFIEQI